MAYGISHKYDDIIGYSRPEPSTSHPRMGNDNRAKIFSPFAALRGYEDTVEAVRRVRTNKQILSDEVQQELNERIMKLKKHDMVTVTYFRKDVGSDGSGGMADGEYLTCSGEIIKLEAFKQEMVVRGGESHMDITVEFDDIFSINDVT